MKNQSIPLPMAISGNDYIITHIEKGKVSADALRGYGILPGARIKLHFTSPSGNPAAYEIMGAMLALRHEDVQGIYILPAALHQKAHICGEL